MSDYCSVQNNLNRFFNEIHLKKQYLRKMQIRVNTLNKTRRVSYKKVGSKFLTKLAFLSGPIFVTYIVEISFFKKKATLHVSNSLGSVKVFHSIDFLKEKKARAKVLQKFYRILSSKIKFVKKIPLAIHFKNVDFNMFRFLKKLKKKFFVAIVRRFSKYPHNGCRKRKIRRKKFKSKFFNI